MPKRLDDEEMHMAITIEIIDKSTVGNTLGLSDKNLNNDDIEIICDYLKRHQEINELNVSYNNIGDEGAKALAANTSLTSLNVRGNNIGDEGAKALAANTRLTSLDVRGNNIAKKASTSNISMMVLGGFIAAAGIAAVAVAFTVLNAATFGVAGGGLACAGAAAALSGVGLFAAGTKKYIAEKPEVVPNPVATAAT